MIKFSIITGLLFMFLNNVISCKQKTVQEKFMSYINDTNNHIFQKQIANGVEMTVRYMPAEYQKLISGYKTSRGYRDNISMDVKFTKRELKKDKATNLYLDFDIQNDFQLKVNDGFLSPVFCQKIENGIKDNYEYMVVFELPLLENSGLQQADLIYTDRVFGIGQRKFIFKKKDIQTIPKLTSSL